MRTLNIAIVFMLAVASISVNAHAEDKKDAVKASLRPSILFSEDKVVTRAITFRPNSDLSQMSVGDFLWKPAGKTDNAPAEAIVTDSIDCGAVTTCTMMVKLGKDTDGKFDFYIHCQDCEGKTATLTVKNQKTVEEDRAKAKQEQLEANIAAGAAAAKKVKDLQEQLNTTKAANTALALRFDQFLKNQLPAGPKQSDIQAMVDQAVGSKLADINAKADQALAASNAAKADSAAAFAQGQTNAQQLKAVSSDLAALANTPIYQGVFHKRKLLNADVAGRLQEQTAASTK